MGLDASAGTIAELAASTAPSPVFGLPLTPNEEALLLERGRIQDGLSGLVALRSARQAVWGGMWLSYPVGSTLDHALVVNVALTITSDVRQAEIQRLIPSGADLVIHTAANTEAQLDALHQVIAEDVSFFESIGAELHTIATDETNNVVELVVDHADSETASLIQARYGAGRVVVREGGAVTPDLCSRADCGPPWLAGLKIARTSPTGFCTSGFVVHKYQGIWLYALWTSGHCTSGTWREGSTSGTVIGTTGANFFAEGSDADVQVIPITPTDGGLDDYLYGSALCVECIKKDVASKECKDCDITGELLTNNGAFSGVRYGTLQNRNVTCLPADCGYTLVRQRRATYTRMAGDSGGPVTSWVASQNEYAKAAGSHMHYQTISGTEYAIYSHVAEMEEIAGWTVWY